VIDPEIEPNYRRNGGSFNRFNDNVYLFANQQDARIYLHSTQGLQRFANKALGNKLHHFWCN